MRHRKPRSLTKSEIQEYLVMWWVSHQIVGKAKVILSNDILIYEVSCFTKVYSKVAITSGMAMETWGPSFFESLGTHSRVFGQSAYRVLFPQKSGSGPDHCSLYPFNLPSTVQVILLGLYLRWIPGDLSSEGSAMVSYRHLHSRRLPGSLKTKSDSGKTG